MHLDVFLSLFSLMLVSLAVFILSKRLRVPYTVLLVLCGSFLVPISQIDVFSFITSFQLTPELLFFVFLPILIFESAYNMSVRSVIDNIYSIGLLAIVGLIVSTLFVGVAGYYVFKLAGFEVPMLALLLFGAIISSTDPVAVLALFKEYGAPRRLTLIFEGESLFNDATGFAAFLVVVELLEHGFSGTSSVMTALISFFTMLAGGIIFGLLMGFLFANLIEVAKGNEHLEITLTLLVAHFTFVLAEVISEHLVIYGQEISLSSIIATLAASMVIGNYGRYKMSPAVENYMEKFWGYFAFLANSLVFILMGLLFANLAIRLDVAIWYIMLAIAVAAVGRAVSVYPLLWLLNKTGRQEPIPTSWMSLLSWGSLRGSLAVIMVLLIPKDLTIAGWNLDFTLKQFIAAVTIGSIYFTLLVKATTIGKVMHALKIDALTPEEEVGYYKSQAQMYEESLQKLNDLFKNHLLNKEQYEDFQRHYQYLYHNAGIKCKEIIGDSGELIENMLRIYALGIEKAELKEIFQRREVNEKIYKKIFNMLSIQTERIERGHAQVTSPNEHFPIDGMERLVLLISRLAFWRDHSFKSEELYLYYRTLNKLIERVIERLTSLNDFSLSEIFADKSALDKLLTLYQELHGNTESRMEGILKKNYALLNRLNKGTAEVSLHALQTQTLNELYKNEIISSKLFIRLDHELQERNSSKV
ncbi:Sodium:proton exchanger [Candidatus Methylobacter favarea]|uniref:Sodium:proton exchanger n=1 Tax=Candidatus Methylobacter favarea TaxID=2707345 RepID=A0A8S0X6M2_9GAMM|nr:sodium:proton antiporter [Candidatus Methylobacter favarea]CAA9889355.1 Sodium:proton exchanger [Candidatus Methylobacter favarea]